MKFIKLIIILCLFITQVSLAQVSVYGRVDHIVPDGVDTQGGISLTVSGSTAPYTYTWNPGAIFTKDVNNITSGQYTVNVSSASSQTYTNRYSLGYKVDWTNLYKCYFRNDSLVSTANNYCRAVSKNTLPANTDGWFEYIISEMPIKFGFLGLLDSIAPNVSNFSDIDFGYRFHSSFQTVHYFENGLSTTLYSTPKVGDVFRLERIGNTINYRVNGAIVRTITNASIGGKTYKLKASLMNAARVLNLGCSFLPSGNVLFPNYINTIPFVKHETGVGTSDGSVNLTPEISGTYNYTWQPSGVTTNPYTGLNIGLYGVDIKNSDNILSKKYYSIGYKVNWTNLNRCYFRNDSLVSTSTSVSKAESKNTLFPNTDGWFEFVLSELPFKFGYIGFTDSISPDPANLNDIDFGFRIHEGQQYIYCWENGGNTTLELSPKIGDIYRVERVGNAINYKLNGVVLRTVTQSGLAAKTLKLKANLYNGFKLANLGCSFLPTGNGYFANYVHAELLVKHASDLGVNDASILATPKIAGTYTYTWVPSGITTNPVANQAPGNHSVRINDSDNNSSDEYRNVGYKVNWTNLNQCTFRNDSLVSTTGLYYSYCKAVSKNTLPANTNGWFEFVLNELPYRLGYIGFLDSVNINAGTVGDIDYGIYLYSDGLRIGWYENGTFNWLTSTAAIGSIIRIERIGNTINYKINGVTLRTVTNTSIGTKVFKLKAALTNAIKIVNLGCSFSNGANISFPGYVEVRPTIVRSSGFGINDGSISIQKDFFGIKDYNWAPSVAATANISNLVNGTHTVTVSDSSNNQTSYKYDVGYKAIWKNFDKCFSRNDTLKGTGANGQFTYACSKNILESNNDGWVEYVLNTLPGGSSSHFLGFTDSVANNPAISTDIQYGFYYYAAGKTLNYIEGSQSASNLVLRTPTIGDVLRLERIGNTINYRVNGIIVRTVTNAAIGPKVFKLKARMYVNNFLTNIGCSFTNNLGIESSAVSNYENDSIQGHVNLTKISGGLPPYQIAWNNVKVPTNNFVINYLALSTNSTVIVDTVKVKNMLDTLRLKTKYSNLLPGSYPFKIFDKKNDSICAVAMVGSKIDWEYNNAVMIESKISKSKFTNNTFYLNSSEQEISQIGVFKEGNSMAIANNHFGNNFNNYIQFNYPNSSYKSDIGLMAKTSTLSTSINKTWYRFDGLGSVKIYFLDSIIYSGTANTDDTFSMSNDTLTGQFRYFKNGVQLVSRQYSRLNPENGLLFSVLMGSAGAKINGIIVITSPIYTKNNLIINNIQDVTCSNPCVGSMEVLGSFNAFTNPIKFELVDLVSNAIISAQVYNSGPNSAIFSGVCAGKYKVNYYYEKTYPIMSYGVVSKLVEIAYMPEWVNLGSNTSVSSTDNTLTKTGGVSNLFQWYDGASSVNKLKNSDNGWIEWTAGSPPNVIEAAGIGFNNLDVDKNIVDIDYGIGFYEFFGTRTYVFTNNQLIINALFTTPHFYGNYSQSSVFRLEKDATGIFKFSINGQLIPGATFGFTPGSDLVLDASLQFTNSKIRHPRMSFGCPYVQQFAIPEKKLDGGYYTVNEQKLLFKYTEEYKDTDGKLKFNIYNAANTIVFSSATMGLSSPIVAVGDNRYSIDLANASYLVSGQTMPGNNFYILEIINEKNEKWYLRFKK